VVTNTLKNHSASTFNGQAVGEQHWSILLGLLGTEDEDTLYVQNIECHSPNGRASHPQRPEF
jgi:hypothetical protein